MIRGAGLAVLAAGVVLNLTACSAPGNPSNNPSTPNYKAHQLLLNPSNIIGSWVSYGGSGDEPIATVDTPMSSCLAKGRYLAPTAVSTSGELRPSWSSKVSARVEARVYPVSSVDYVFSAFNDVNTLQCVMNAVMIRDYRHTELGFVATANQVPTTLNVSLTPPAGFKLMVAGFNFDGSVHGNPAILHHLLLMIAKGGYVEWVELGALAEVGGDKTSPTPDMTKALSELEAAAITSLSRPGL